MPQQENKLYSLDQPGFWLTKFKSPTQKTNIFYQKAQNYTDTEPNNYTYINKILNPTYSRLESWS